MNHHTNKHQPRVLETESFTALKMTDRDLGETQPEKVETTVLQLAKIPKIQGMDEAPKWLVYNDFLDHGYRVDYENNKDLVRSVFMLHNETTNIWTHLIAAIIFMFLLYNSFFYFDPLKMVYKKFAIDLSEIDWKKYSSGMNYNALMKFIDNLKNQGINGFWEFQNFYKFWREQNGEGTNKVEEKVTNLMRAFPEIFQKFKSPNSQDQEAFKTLFQTAHFGTLTFNLPKFPLLIFEVTAIICMTCSSIMHIFWVKSEETCEKVHKLDLGGIVIMILGCSVSVIYFQFYCMPWFSGIYITLNIAAAVLALYVMNGSNEYIRNSNFISSGVYILQASMTFIPYYHWFELSQKGHPHSLDLSENIHWLFVEILSFLVGILFYVMRIPERWIRSKLQLWINSHSIFHTFVFLGSLAHFFAVETILFSRLENNCSTNHGFGY